MWQTKRSVLYEENRSKLQPSLRLNPHTGVEKRGPTNYIWQKEKETWELKGANWGSSKSQKSSKRRIFNWLCVQLAHKVVHDLQWDRLNLGKGDTMRGSHKKERHASCGLGETRAVQLYLKGRELGRKKGSKGSFPWIQLLF